MALGGDEVDDNDDRDMCCIPPTLWVNGVTDAFFPGAAVGDGTSPCPASSWNARYTLNLNLEALNVNPYLCCKIPKHHTPVLYRISRRSLLRRAVLFCILCRALIRTAIMYRTLRRALIRNTILLVFDVGP